MKKPGVLPWLPSFGHARHISVSLGLEAINYIKPRAVSRRASFSLTSRRALYAIPVLAAAFALSGCAVDSNGRISLDVEQATSRELYHFKTAFGDGVLRRTPAGLYQIKLYDRSQIFDLGRTEGVLVDNVTDVDGVTYLTLRMPRPGCDNVYRTLIIKKNEVGKYDLANECQTTVNFGTQDSSWLAVQQKPHNARFWMIRDNRVQSGLVPEAPPVVAVPPVKTPPVRHASKPASTVTRRVATHRNSDPGADAADSNVAAATTAPASSGAHKLQPTSVDVIQERVSTTDVSHQTVHIDLGSH
ncbi:hypothetical protein [Paraburkholderia metrosideri]|uniref:Lipoprotein n=1 Tax=Paraburkholderia metrosideri TaxID=580937 RepID=A0ABN7HQY1_9BURK|nr:hypothetical protein [Paraburkholderia metrosideri]CAD6528464.1 hypothetical protein LMG28140_02128 [Paraburkholderia metrosideri]